MSMEVDFLDTFYGNQELTNFGACLFRLIAKADRGNLLKLLMAYPDEVSLYIWWMSQPEPPEQKEITARIKEQGASV